MLIVEDVAINRMILQQYFESWGNVVADEAVNGEEAIEKVSENTYDLVLMDVRMPVMDGYEATRAIRAMPDGKKDVPIIALTADTAERLKENGASYFTDVLTKPFNPEVLKEMIVQYASNTTSAEASSQRSPNPAQREGEGDDTVTTDPKLVVNFSRAEKPFTVPDQLRKFYRVILQAFREYQEAYAQAVSHQDAEQLYDLAHKMKTSLAMFELNSLYQRLEHEVDLLSAGDADAIQSSTSRTSLLLSEFIQQILQRQQTLERTKISNVSDF